MQAVEQSLSKQNSDWVSEANIPDPSGLRPCGFRIIVRPVGVKAKTKGGIIIPEKTRDDIAYLTTTGKVLAIGPLAFTRADMLLPVTDSEGSIVAHRVSPWYKVGDFVTYGKFAGAKRIFKGVKILILNDDEPIDVIDNPYDIDPNYNLAQGS